MREGAGERERATEREPTQSRDAGEQACVSVSERQQEQPNLHYSQSQRFKQSRETLLKPTAIVYVSFLPQDQL